MSAQHTPGPWRFEEHSESSQWLGNVIGSYGRNTQGIEQIRTITCQTRYESTQGEALANARLIAVAPELLEALELVARRADAVQEVCGGTVQHSDLLIATIAARAAIAKATGGAA